MASSNVCADDVIDYLFKKKINKPTTPPLSNDTDLLNVHVWMHFVDLLDVVSIYMIILLRSNVSLNEYLEVAICLVNLLL